MSEKSYSSGVGISSWLLFAILGYFVYDGLAGAFGMALMAIALGFLSVLGLIPFLGAWFYYVAGKSHAIPAILSFTGLETTWLVDVMFAVYGIFAVIMTIAVSLAAIAIFLAWILD